MVTPVRLSLKESHNGLNLGLKTLFAYVKRYIFSAASAIVGQHLSAMLELLQYPKGLTLFRHIVSEYITKSLLILPLYEDLSV